MSTPSDAADPNKAKEFEDQSQTSGTPLSSSQARGDDLRDDTRLDDPDDRTRDDVGRGTEPTTEQTPGELPDESQGPA